MMKGMRTAGILAPPALPRPRGQPGDPENDTPIPEVIFDKTKSRTYNRGRFLGKGGFARCYEVRDMRTNEIFACKIVNKNLLTKQHHREKMAQEISIHRELHHEYIVSFFSFFEDDSFVYIVLELCTKKSLMELQKRRRVLQETEARYFLHEIMLAVTYLHTNNIIHRDLKLGNIFISEQIHLKIGDFGLATIIEFSGERKRTLCGTPNYIAPEILNKKGHSFEVDIWSIGCILYTLLVGKPPFETATLKDTYMKIKKGDYYIPSGKISTPARTLIQSMLMVDPGQRPSAQQILQSDFLCKNPIPKGLPASILTMAPRFTFPTPEKDIIPSVIKRPLVDHNPKSPVTAGNGTILGLGKPSDNPPPWKQHATTAMNNLLKQMRKVMLSEPMKKVGPGGNDDNVEDPNSAPLLWIGKWVDYSDKYGFGYQLSDNAIGVSFNDMTKMILHADGRTMHYIDKTGKEHYHQKDEYPMDLQKKVKLLNYFRQYMNENLLKAGGDMPTPESANMARLPCVWTWFRTSRAVVMVLSNGTMQINNFREHTKTILCPLMEAITVLEQNKGPMRTYKFSAIEKYGCTPYLASKITYAIEKIEMLL